MRYNTTTRSSSSWLFFLTTFYDFTSLELGAFLSVHAAYYSTVRTAGLVTERGMLLGAIRLVLDRSRSLVVSRRWLDRVV